VYVHLVTVEVLEAEQDEFVSGLVVFAALQDLAVRPLDGPDAQLEMSTLALLETSVLAQQHFQHRGRTQTQHKRVSVRCLATDIDGEIGELGLEDQVEVGEFLLGGTTIDDLLQRVYTPRCKGKQVNARKNTRTM
jgi:hypothetical protein